MVRSKSVVLGFGEFPEMEVPVPDFAQVPASPCGQQRQTPADATTPNDISTVHTSFISISSNNTFENPKEPTW